MSFRLSRLLPLLFLLVFPVFRVAAQPAAGGGAACGVGWLQDARTVVPGKPFRVALRLTVPEGWHSYYQNSGGVELPLSLKWDLPPGFSAGAVEWPQPEVVDGAFGKSYVYGGAVVFVVGITPDASVAAGKDFQLVAHARWQICKDQCIEEKAEGVIRLRTGASVEADDAGAAGIAAARAALPQVSPAWKPRLEKSGAEFRLRLTPGAGAGGPEDVYFIPDQKFIDSAKPQKVSRDGKDIVLALPVAAEDMFGNKLEIGDRLSGILLSKTSWETGAERKSLLVPEVVAGAGAGSSAGVAGKAPADAGGWWAYLQVFGLMFAGGLLLNLMPCVFPVIGLKILGFVQQAGQDRRKIAWHGVLFAGGVMVSFWVLSGFLFAARVAALSGAGPQRGWGYQLQEPALVLGLMVLMLVMGMSLFGVFEMGVSATGVGGKLASKQGALGTFFSGVLATVVSTPCSGPLLGSAIGVAIGLPTLPFFLAFSAMGLGLSAPYLLLSAFPALVDRMPRPGAWMETFKQGMSFLLFGTVGYLLWVYTGQIGLDNMLYPLCGLTVVAFAVWVYGRWCVPTRPVLTRRLALCTALALGASGVWTCRPPVNHVEWENWSEARVNELLGQGRPVYVDFTAKWCATCQLNKKRAYSDEVVALMKQRGVVLLRGDKTNSNPAVDAKLLELGRAAIPVNVLYVPGKDPVITPELLSAGYVLDLIRTQVPERR